MRATASAARGAWAVVAVATPLSLLATGAGRDAPPAATCARPAEAAARDGFTSAVRCDGRGGALRGPARLLYGLRLDLNRADPRALEALPGVGPARAAAIARERARRPFTGAADLARVAGIGPATVRALRPHVQAGDAVPRPGGQAAEAAP